MYVHNDHRINRLAGLGTALMTRDVACGGYYPPGSAAWNSWGCGATAAPAPSPAPTPPSRSTNVVIPAAPPPPAPTYITVDNAASRAAEAQYAARQRAEMEAAEAARAAATAKAEAEALKNAPQVVTGSYVAEGGLAPVTGGGYSGKVSAPAPQAAAEPMEAGTPWWVWVAGAAAAGFALTRRRGRRG